MTRSMTRWMLAGCTVLAALSAVSVLDVGLRAADAAPTVSPFAGTYVGGVPVGWYPSWTVTISRAGRITSSFTDNSAGTKGSISGDVGPDGGYSFTLIITTPSYDEGPRDRRVPRTKWTFASAGNMELDAGGNIVGMADTGRTFVWVRQ